MKVVEKSRTHILRPIAFSESVALFEIIIKNQRWSGAMTVAPRTKKVKLSLC
jgi:hypothetical protein